MNRWKNDDVTATTREAIRLVDQYESDEAYARRLHEELNGGEDADLQPPRRPQPYRFGPVSNRIESVSNVGEMRQELQRASEDITNINAPELIRHLSFSSEVDDMIPTSSGFDGNRFIQAETEQGSYFHSEESFMFIKIKIMRTTRHQLSFNKYPPQIHLATIPPTKMEANQTSDYMIFFRVFFI